MTIFKAIIHTVALLLPVIALTGCSDNHENKLGTVAKIGNGGSLDGAYNLSDIWVTSVNGGSAGFGYGAVNGYPGASASIGISVPRHIKGYWAKENEEGPGFQSYYRISADIDSVLAEKKIRTLQNYYQTFKSNWGHMQVEVEQSRIMVLYTLNCFSKLDDCTVKPYEASHDLVSKSPKNLTDVAVLFDGKGESSLTPFPGSPYDERRVLVNPPHLGHKITLTDTQGRTASVGRGIGDLTRLQGDWKNYIGEDEVGKSMYRFFHMDEPIDTDIIKEKIQIIRKDLAHKAFPSVTYVTINNDGHMKLYYRLICVSDTELCDSLEESRASPLVIRSSDYDLDILLFEGKAEELDAPYETVSDPQ
ncbi:hypothetical protein A8139_10995 [Marinomonas primoryensis]|uniref:DUF2931 domain-containing protein n=1 Tax=Marinomonas primoryensis TaxID=178399 RepID=A0A2Z4PSR6_9GAMM|nr:hypothetical protein A8139_10995 [Marinomonas primoryensis]